MKVTRANIWRIGILFSFIAIIGAVSVSWPNVLADNGFLNGLMGPDLVAVLVVVLTITFASVANVHLSIGRLVSNAADKATAMAAARRARSELNSNAWLIFWAFLVAMIALVLNGALPGNAHVDAVTTAVCLTVILLNGLVMHDIYRSIFLLVASDHAAAASGQKQDFTNDSPRA